ncbi:MAG: glycosyltransferase [Patescibacteria group bacterium]
MKRIYIALDWKCATPERIAADKLGHTEQRMLMLTRHLLAAGYDVVAEPTPEPNDFDIAVHSNGFQPGLNARKHIVWAGSWHFDPNEHPYDRIMFVSDFMREKFQRPDADVVPACYDDTLFQPNGRHYVPFRIVSTSNPNRYHEHAREICGRLMRSNVPFEWHYCGGNKLYGDEFWECFSPGEQRRMVYQGILSQAEVVAMLQTAHVWAYPNFTDGSETFCAAAVEAVAVGIPVIVPKRQPFLDVLGKCAIYAENAGEFAKAVHKVFFSNNRPRYDVTRYSSAIVLQRVVEIIEEVCSE